MKVLFCTSEAYPFASSGGLGEVAESLPKALRKRVIGCRVVLPLYEDIPQELLNNMNFLTSFSVPVSWRRQYCGVFQAKYNGVIYYFIDNQYYFKRKGFYGYYDDAERFAFFSRAILEMLSYIDFKPDIIHANDWQTALLPIYYSIYYSNYDWYKGIKTLFTIHNIQYQGKYGTDLMNEILGLPEHNLNVLQFDDNINLMKGAIETAHRVNTVSPTYANEILDPWFSHGLDSILKKRQWKLSGILNGIDTDKYNPETDIEIYKNYTIDNIKDKKKNKLELQKRLGLEQNSEIPLIGMVTRLVSHKGLDLVKQAMEQLMNSENIQFAVLGSGDWEYEDFFRKMSERYPGRFVSYIGFVPELSRKIYAGSDMFLMPSKSEPCGLSQMIALRYGSIPIVRSTGGLKDSIIDCGDGTGNGFTFQLYNYEDMLASIRRAISCYWSKDNSWDILIKRAMQSDNSWRKSANEYIKLYKSILA